MNRMRLVKKREKALLITLVIVVLLFVVFYLGVKLRYEYWHFYVHNKLTVFLDKEFRVLLTKYGKANSFASFEAKDQVGVIVTYPMMSNSKYSIQLRLAKNTKRDDFLFRAEISSPMKKTHYDTGNPPIHMLIPIEYFDKVVERGLTQHQINRLVRTAEREGWEPMGVSKTVKLKPPIVLDFGGE